MRVLFFPLENYARELDARSLIISKLSRIKSIDTVPSDNMICVLLPKNLLPLILSKISQPVTVLHKSLQLHFREFISSIVSKGGSYFFLEEEYFDRYSDNSVRFGSEGYATGAFASTHTDFVSLSERLPNKVFFTGNPRVDVLKDAQRLFEDTISTLNQRYGRFFLFNSNFSFTNPPRDHHLSSLDKEFCFKSEEDKQNLLSFLTSHSSRFELVKRYLILLSENSIYDSVIYRPHPNESITKAQTHFDGTSVTVDNSGNVLPWIVASSCMAHCGCTTAIESYLLQKKSIFLFPFESDRQSLSYQLSSMEYFDNRLTIIPNTHNTHDLGLPSSQKSNSLHPSSISIARILLRYSRSLSLLYFLKETVSSVLFNCISIVSLYRSEKESTRRNASIKDSLRRFGLRKHFSIEFLGVSIIFL